MKTGLLKALAFIITLACFSPWQAHADTGCDLSFPSGTTLTADVTVYPNFNVPPGDPDWTHGFTSPSAWFALNVTDPSSPIPPGVYGAFCVDQIHFLPASYFDIPGDSYTGYLISTCDANGLQAVPDHGGAPPVGPTVSLDTWHKVNYILNHKDGYYWWNIQVAIARIVGGPAPNDPALPNPDVEGYPPATASEIDAIVADANANAANWTIPCGGVIGALFIVPDPAVQPDPSESLYQIIVVEVPKVCLTCPTTCGTVGSPYSSSLNGGARTQPYTYTVTDGSLPTGLILDPLTGAISGLPLEAGTFAFSVTLMDSTLPTPLTKTVSCSITIYPAVTVNSGAICAGDSITLTALAPANSTFQWSNGAATQSITVSPSTTTDYSVTVTFPTGCSSSASTTVTVNPQPTVTVASTSICPGGVATLTAVASPGVTYLWTPGNFVTPSILVSPATTTTYTITVTGAGGCKAMTTATVTVSDTTPPVLACPADKILSGSVGGAALYCGYTPGGWGAPPSGSNPGALLANNFATVYPQGIEIGIPGTAGYSIKFTSAAGVQAYLPAGSTPGALNTDLTNPTSSSAGVFAGHILALKLNTDFSAAGITPKVSGAFGNLVYTDLTSLLSGKTVSQILAIAQTALGGGALPIGVSISDLNAVLTQFNQAFDNCTTTPWAVAHLLPLTQTVDTTPLVTGFAAAMDTCDANPTVTYSDVVTQGNCGGYQIARTWKAKDASGNFSLCTQTITVLGTSAPSVTVNSGAVCAGGSMTLTASGATGTVFYRWSNGATTQSITVSPSATTTYTVTVTTAGGCTTTASGTVTVTPPPTVSVASKSICVGGSATLTATASAGATYKWNTGATTQSITVSPTATTSYTVTVTGSGGCTASATGTVTVNPLPTVSVASTSVCPGGSATLTATASAGATFKWNTGATTQSITVSPTTTTSYSVTVTSPSGCAATATGTVTVTAAPTVTVASTTMCAGDTVTLTAVASAGVTYKWNTGATTQSITVSPSATTSYSVTVTAGGGCTATASATVTVTPYSRTLGSFNFAGSTASTGTAGNVRTYTDANGVSVKVTAFSRTSSGTWAKAYLGAYSGGLGVTDVNEDGSAPGHTVDNSGNDNYLLFEFSQPVIVSSAYLGYVTGDSDMSVRIGTFADPYNNHLTLSDSVLGSFGYSEENAGGSATRTATLNANGILGNALIIAASLTDKASVDQFKVQTLSTFKPVCFSPVSIGNFVWNDVNQNGIQDSGEAGINGVKLTLTGTTGSGGSVTLSTVTAGNGAYLFSGLEPGTYTVTVDSANFNTGGALYQFQRSPTLVGTNRGVDSNVSPSGTSPATLPSATSDLTVDFGFYKVTICYGSISGKIFRYCSALDDDDKDDDWRDDDGKDHSGCNHKYGYCSRDGKDHSTCRHSRGWCSRDGQSHFTCNHAGGRCDKDTRDHSRCNHSLNICEHDGYRHEICDHSMKLCSHDGRDHSKCNHKYDECSQDGQDHSKCRHERGWCNRDGRNHYYCDHSHGTCYQDSRDHSSCNHWRNYCANDGHDHSRCDHSHSACVDDSRDHSSCNHKYGYCSQDGKDHSICRHERGWCSQDGRSHATCAHASGRCAIETRDHSTCNHARNICVNDGNNHSTCNHAKKICAYDGRDHSGCNHQYSECNQDGQDHSGCRHNRGWCSRDGQNHSTCNHAGGRCDKDTRSHTYCNHSKDMCTRDGQDHSGCNHAYNVCDHVSRDGQADRCGLGGFTVKLMNGATVVATTTSAADGSYMFNNIVPGTYYIVVVPATNYAPVWDIDDCLDNSTKVVVGNCQDVTCVDFGYKSTLVCGDAPSPWNSKDIGCVQATGKSSYASGVFKVIGSGDDIWDCADDFRFVYQAASGDCAVVARVTGVQNTDGWAKAGVMIRSTLDSNSKHASVFITPENGVAFQSRNATGGGSVNNNVTGKAAPYWVKIVRSGSTFTAYYSSNGSTWTSMGSQSISMGTTVYIGLAVVSHDDGTLCTATFDSVTATP